VDIIGGFVPDGHASDLDVRFMAIVCPTSHQIFMAVTDLAQKSPHH
jgi:hypothetical protein